MKYYKWPPQRAIFLSKFLQHQQTAASTNNNLEMMKVFEHQRNHRGMNKKRKTKRKTKRNVERKTKKRC